MRCSILVTAFLVRAREPKGWRDRLVANPARPHASRGRLWVATGVAVVAVVLLDVSPAQAQAGAGDGAEPEQVMAAFVSRFPHFVEWPDSALQGRETIDICVAEPDPFEEDLENLIEGEELHGRRLTIRRIGHPSRVEGCHVLFVSSPSERASEFLEQIEGQPVLTVGESSDFLDAGGIINLLIINQRVRFAVNADAASRAGLRLSSQLLGLATDVRGVP